MLQEQKLIGAAPSDVAHFLEKTQGLNKTMIGDYLGERDDFNLKVMHAYVDAMEFSGMEFDEAIRCRRGLEWKQGRRVAAPCACCVKVCF